MKFVGPSYTLNHRDADIQRAVNLFPVTVEAAGGKAVDYLDSIPGLGQFADLTDAIGFILQEDGFFLLVESGEKLEIEV